MTAPELIKICLDMKGSPRVYVREGFYVLDKSQGAVIPTIWISFHRQANRRFQKSLWEHLLIPAGTLLIFKQESHDFLRKTTGDARVVIEPKVDAWSHDEGQFILKKSRAIIKKYGEKK